ncbi:MAG TPA: DUF1525 domain-containing protein [Anaerolineales bacterium]
MNRPVFVEIIAYAPTAFYHCLHCEVAFREMGKSDHVQKEQLSNSLPADLMDDYVAVSDWVRQMLSVHDDKIAIKVIDAASIEGVLQSVRYGTRHFPAVIVNHKGRFQGQTALDMAAGAIDQLLYEPARAATFA